jgi:hypothetical protein
VRKKEETIFNFIAGFGNEYDVSNCDSLGIHFIFLYGSLKLVAQ